uniref:Uncharacterized protein n=1 Tax=Tetraselmis sp. GSL018 TaxID=582737 RepID=A0A061SHA5_9CHLO
MLTLCSVLSYPSVGIPWKRRDISAPEDLSRAETLSERERKGNYQALLWIGVQHARVECFGSENYLLFEGVMDGKRQHILL